VHENEVALDEVLRILPVLVDTAVSWEGCDEGSAELLTTQNGSVL
jgi:hypothetical protein